MRPPINLYGFTSEVIYPSSIFSLERHENLPYERFAYNVFREAISALDKNTLPLKLAVEFLSSSEACPGWEVNCSVRAEKSSSGNFDRIVIQSPELLPTLLLMFSVCIGRHLFSEEGRVLCLKDPNLLTAHIQRFFDSASSVVRAYRTQGLASAIRTGYEFLGINFSIVDKSIDCFDSLSYLIANHEVAHIHVGQFSVGFGNSKEVSKAFEIIADLVASEWLFRRYIYFTPDTEAYRLNRHFSSHAEAVWSNAKWAIDTQLALLILMGVSGAQASGGRFHFDGGMRHPGSFGRYWLQQAWLFAAIDGYFRKLLGDEAYQRLMTIWKEYFDILCGSGLVSRRALLQVVDDEDVQIISRVADLVESRKIEELRPGVEFLRSRQKDAEAMRSRMLSIED